ncbi:MAG: isoprenylcysteine carboxylmethyltransferase family protein [Bacteroidota bacterium]
MENKKDSPGVYTPPPLIYVVTFLAALLVQKFIPIDASLIGTKLTKITGIIFFMIAVFFLFRSLRQFFYSKNTLILIKPAFSLQTGGIYNITRNPMYVGLAFIYLGVSCFIGNWWNIILFPLLLVIVQERIIKCEEKYLERRFGTEYISYKTKVRRWL